MTLLIILAVLIILSAIFGIIVFDGEGLAGAFLGLLPAPLEAEMKEPHKLRDSVREIIEWADELKQLMSEYNKKLKEES